MASIRTGARIIARPCRTVIATASIPNNDVPFSEREVAQGAELVERHVNPNMLEVS